MRKTVLLVAVLTVLLLTSCTPGKQQTSELAAPKEEMEQSKPLEQGLENEIAEATSRYESNHISLSYSPEALELHETAVSGNGETYLITLTERGADEGAIPRLDILSVKMAGFAEAQAMESAEFALAAEFNRFVEEILCAYYISEDEGIGAGAVSIKMREPQIETDASGLLCKTQASVGAMNGIPAVNASVEMQCAGEDGIIIILLVPGDVIDPRC